MEHNASRLIDFAYLSFDEAKLIGRGAFSRVYKGWLRGNTAVAVKFFVRLEEVTAESIALYAKETAILAAVSRHPNVVHFHGLCVRPPAILLVMEYCSKGSLFDVLRSEHAALKAQPQRLWRMCLDVCKSVAFLHSLVGVSDPTNV